MLFRHAGRSPRAAAFFRKKLKFPLASGPKPCYNVFSTLMRGIPDEHHVRPLLLFYLYLHK